MRAGPLSNDKVIALLNRYFVPVFTSNEDYSGKGAVVPADERAAVRRIYEAALKAKLSAGSVHAYVVTPDGRPVDSLHVAQAAQVEQTQAMLERAVKQLRPEGGGPVVPPAAQSAPPKAEPGSLVLHLTARYLERKGAELVPHETSTLGTSRNGSWGAYPAENWVVYTPAELATLLPAEARVGGSWDFDPKLAGRLLVHFYPSTECNDVTRNRIERHGLKATVVSVQGGLARARLDGGLRLKHNFYPGREDANRAEAALLGYVDFEPAKRKVRALRLVTDRAKYGTHDFGVAVREVD